VTDDEILMEMVQQHETEKIEWEEQKQALEEAKGQLEVDLLKLQQAFETLQKSDQEKANQLSLLQTKVAQSGQSSSEVQKDLEAKIESLTTTNQSLTQEVTELKAAVAKAQAAEPAPAPAAAAASVPNAGAIKQLQDEIVRRPSCNWGFFPMSLTFGFCFWSMYSG